MPEILDDEGKVINHPGVETTINYQVEVNFAGEKRSFTYASTLLARVKIIKTEGNVIKRIRFLFIF